MVYFVLRFVVSNYHLLLLFSCVAQCKTNLSLAPEEEEKKSEQTLTLYRLRVG